jgi:hypothetical protein
MKPVLNFKKNLLSRLVTLVIEAPSITGISGYHTWSGSKGGGDNLQHSRPIKTLHSSKFTSKSRLRELRKIMPIQAAQTDMMQGR